jgi:N utilization substance protein A
MKSQTVIRQEVLQVADALAREKGIDPGEVIEAIEQAIQKAARAQYGSEKDIRAAINRKTGEIALARYITIVDGVEDMETQISLEDAQSIKPDAKVGECLIDPLPPIDFGRVTAQVAKQVIVNRVRQAERMRQYREYKDHLGEIVNGVVKRVEYGNVTLDLSRAEAFLGREDMIPREAFRTGDRVRALLVHLNPEGRGALLRLSRTHGDFVKKLFMQEVPEVYEGIIEVKSVARDPGSRAKIAVFSKDPNIDPVGACVGMRGSRVQAVVNELQGEKIDIILWSLDPATFVVNALAPAEVSKVVLDDDSNRIEVVVPDDQLSLAIGRRGQNVRLASILTGWSIDIVSESQESSRRQEDFRIKSKLFLEALDVDEVIAHLLVSEGFESVEDIALTPLEEFMRIEGFDEGVATELIQRANTYIHRKTMEAEKLLEQLGVDLRLREISGLTPTLIVMLAEKGIRTLVDFADLAGDELIELLGSQSIRADIANEAIMEARRKCYPEV